MEDLILNNGQTAMFLYIDDWSRPVYRLENGVRVCCVNLNGTFLHTVSGGEPGYSLKQEYQPKDDDFDDEEGPDFTFEYMFLNKLKTDLEYFFGCGNRNEKMLYFSNVQEHILEMKKRLNTLPLDRHPEWLTVGDIFDYESRLN